MPTLSKTEMNWISLLLEKTGAMAKDCIIEEERVIFLLNKGDTGRVIGKHGQNIKQLRSVMGKEVQVVEYGDDAEKMAINTIAPVRVSNVHVRKDKNGKSSVVMFVHSKDRPRAIGKNGSILKRSKAILKRHFDIDNVYINVDNSSNKPKSENSDVKKQEVTN
jgi:N utilization substance protein A